MPPFGLYSMPRNHLYGGSAVTTAQRPVFNSLSFEQNEGTPTAATPTMNDVPSGKNKEKQTKKKERRSDAADTKEGDTTRGKNTPTPSSANAKSEPKSVSTPSSTKKRKRSSEVRVPPSALPCDSPGHQDMMLGPEWLEKLKSSVGNIQANFQRSPESRSSNEMSLGEQKKEKKKKRKEKLKHKRKEAHVRDNAVASSASVERVQGAVSGESVRKKKRKTKESEDVSIDAASTTMLSTAAVAAPKTTPVPLPLTCSSRHTTMKAPNQSPTKVGRDVSNVLVTETPPSQMSQATPSVWKTAIPFSLSKPTTSARGEHKRVMSMDLTIPTSFDNDEPSYTPAIFPKTNKVGEPSTQDSLTSSNLLRYSAPLNDEPKPRPRRNAGSVSSASSMSIKDAFTRMAKPSPTGTTESNPFFRPESKKKHQVETRKEADMIVFNTAFHATQQTVNFPAEQRYLAAHLSWRASNNSAGPLPCLTIATGCSLKAEAALRITQDNNATKHPITNPTSAPQRAVTATLTAEFFLSNALSAKTPVPIGKLHGTYTLYCPNYTATHMDKYAYGQRTLSISRPAGFSGTSYTARLMLPPRPMAFSILTFEPPPHASFRATRLTTACAERYAMDLVCLGNGYVLLRLDMGLLLTGKKSERGEVCMEFVGVRERDVKGCAALEWVGVGGMGGGGGGGVKGVVVVGGADGSPRKRKKKRSWPSECGEGAEGGRGGG
ncbi:hypothetical protein GQ44DRAFT_758881 [Phaeosphaeriaceae sp. PMI808]|nr:hypothetical protein GQ44DRAFT_758881 [Phaeosphaeriaceae sp. PMI808]